MGRPGGRREPARIAPASLEGAVRAAPSDQSRPKEAIGRPEEAPGSILSRFWVANVQNPPRLPVETHIRPKSTFSLLGLIWGGFWRLRDPFWRSRGPFWPPRAARGASWAPPGRSPGPPERSFGAPGALPKRSWAALGVTWAPRGASGRTDTLRTGGLSTWTANPLHRRSGS